MDRRQLLKGAKSMSTSGFYVDPLKRHFSRFYTGEGWTYRVRDEAGNEQTYFDSDINDEFLRWMDPPDKGSLIEAVNFELPIQVPEDEHDKSDTAAQLLSEFHSESHTTNPGEGDWVQGFSSRVRLNVDTIEIQVQSTEKRSTFLLSDWQDVLNEGLRTIPLRTIQAVHLAKARRGMMGALQFTVPGALTQQHRDSAGKMMRLFLNTDISTKSQAHENSISFELSQQDEFIKFHALIVKRIEELSTSSHVSSSSSIDVASQIRELKTLFDEGVLSEDEFAKAKDALLKRL